MNKSAIYRAAFNATKAVLDVSDMAGIGLNRALDTGWTAIKDVGHGVRDAVYDKQVQIIDGVITHRE